MLIQSLRLVSNEPSTFKSFFMGLTAISGTIALLANDVFRTKGDQRSTVYNRCGVVCISILWVCGIGCRI